MRAYKALVKRSQIGHANTILVVVLVLGLLGTLGFVCYSSFIHSKSDAGNLKTIGREVITTNIDRPTCALLGRVWVATTNIKGCSATKCLRHDTSIGSISKGNEICKGKDLRYGEQLSIDICQSLHRKWINAANTCLLNIERKGKAKFFYNAKQCEKSDMTYVVVPDRQGKDICVDKSDFEKYLSEAKSQKIAVLNIILKYSKGLCDIRTGSNWSTKTRTCLSLQAGEHKHLTSRDVAVFGDSITWRGSNEMLAMQPRWFVDGLPGSKLESLKDRYHDYLRLHTPPKTLVIALGTNNTRETASKKSFENAAKLVSAKTKVVFVTPYRDAKIYGANRKVFLGEESQWMKQIANTRPNTCIADWRSYIEKRPNLLIDGVHPTESGEKSWATFVVNAIKHC